jgi:hypothetical protein
MAQYFTARRADTHPGRRFRNPFYHGDDLILIEGFVNYEFLEWQILFKNHYQAAYQNRCVQVYHFEVLLNSFTLNGEEFAELDYGDGTCDDVATITKNGETRRITIGRRLKKFWAR